MVKAMLIDTSMCLFCNACSVECKQQNKVPIGKNLFYTQMVIHEQGKFPKVKQRFIKRACNHCTEAACVDVCPTRELYHHKDGYVVLDQSRCNGCGYCSQFCPFQIPQLEIMDIFSGTARAHKCTFCAERVGQGYETSCAAACPFGAITFGDREKLIAQGKDRVKVMLGRGLAEARVYGEKELGGLHVLYVLEQRPGYYGLPENPRYPAIPKVLDAVKVLGYAALGATVVGLGVNWVIARRNIRAEEGAEKEEGKSHE
jgi:formate dehydrogenase iron-sulfur subunit